ncbi:MAG: fasciclin domain-containing protein [Bacteroidota bacterium]
MLKNISLFALIMVIAVGCADPISVTESEAPAVQSERGRFMPPDGARFPDQTIAAFVVDQVDQTGEFSVLLEAVSRAGLVDALTTNKPLTVFAPTNDAFIKLLGDLGVGSLDELIDVIGIDGLTDVLLYHIVSGRATAEVVLGSSSLTTLQGGSLVPGLGDGGAFLTDENGRTSNILAVNFLPRNGVVHVIDTVVLP